MASTLQARYDALHREMMDEFERTAARENHWLFYFLLGWGNMLACAVSYYLLEIEGVQTKWPYVVIWLIQFGAAVGTNRLVTGPPPKDVSPLKPMNKRVWIMYLFLCINVNVLNVLAGQSLFTFLPALAALSSMAFTAVTVLMSKKFMPAGLFMFVVGIAMAKFPAYGFLIYGAGWMIVLHAIGVVFLAKRKRWLVVEEPVPAMVEMQDCHSPLATRT